MSLSAKSFAATVVRLPCDANRAKCFCLSPFAKFQNCSQKFAGSRPSKFGFRYSSPASYFRKSSVICLSSDTPESPSPSSDSIESGGVKVTFRLTKQCAFGQRFYVAGEHEVLGGWELEKALPAEWSEGHIWSATTVLPRDSLLPFKFVMVGKRGEVEWQAGENLVLDTSAVGPAIDVQVEWDASSPQVILEPGSASVQTTSGAVVLVGPPPPAAITLLNDFPSLNLEAALAAVDGEDGALTGGEGIVERDEGIVERDEGIVEREAVGDAVLVAGKADVALRVQAELESELGMARSVAVPVGISAEEILEESDSGIASVEGNDGEARS